MQSLLPRVLSPVSRFKVIMRRSTRRRLKRFFRDPLNIAAAVFAIVGAILIPVVPPSSGSLWLAVWLFLIVVAWLVIDLHRAASVSEFNYFEEIRFGEPTEYLVVRGAQGLLNSEKVQPQFVHAAPINKEVEVVCQALRETGFSTLHGGPGEGKSMTAYHAAYRLYREARYSPYALRVDLLEGRFVQEIRDDVLEQLDRLKGKGKLIIVDDAHKLADRRALNRLMREEASDEVLKVIWIETEFYEETIGQRSPSHIRIDFRKLGDQLVANLYRSPDVTLQFALQGKADGLDEAIAKAANDQIRDAWHFAFVASRGEQRVEEEISKLDNAETLVLFLISAYKVISGEAELSTAKLMNLLGTLKFGWFVDSLRDRSFAD
jgi:hypothetical protein